MRSEVSPQASPDVKVACCYDTRLETVFSTSYTYLVQITRD
jgi:hypothetical protein